MSELEIARQALKEIREIVINRSREHECKGIFCSVCGPCDVEQITVAALVKTGGVE